MIVIKVWGLPEGSKGSSKEKLRTLYRDIIAKVVTVKEVSLNEEDVTVFFPSDKIEWDPGEEIIIEIAGLFDKSKRERIECVQSQLAQCVGELIKQCFQFSNVKCLIQTTNPQISKLWISGK
jgi:hypothetical protein